MARGLISYFPTTEEVAKHFSACGWRWNPDSRAWFKGDDLTDAISGDAIDDILRVHPWAVPEVWRALQEGRNHFSFTVSKEGDEFVARLKIR